MNHITSKTFTRDELHDMVARKRLNADTEAMMAAIDIRSIKSLDIYKAMTAQACAFHVLSEKTPGVSPWDPVKLYMWAKTSSAPTNATLCVVRFLLMLWNQTGFRELEKETRKKARLGEFNVLDAMACWDARNAAAFLAWASNPWWP